MYFSIDPEPIPSTNLSLRKWSRSTLEAKKINQFSTPSAISGFLIFFLLIENENEMHLACDYLLLSSMIKVILESCVVPCIVWIFSFFFMVFFTLFYFCVKDRYILVFFLNPSFNGEKSVRTFYV